MASRSNVIMGEGSSKLDGVRSVSVEDENCFQHTKGEIANTSLKIKRTGKLIKIESKNALRGLKFDTEIAKT